MKNTFLTLLLALGVPLVSTAQEKASLEQLAKWLKRFPAADTNKDGTLSIAEATAFRDKMLGGKTGKKSRVVRPRNSKSIQAGRPKNFLTTRFAIYLQTPSRGFIPM